MSASKLITLPSLRQYYLTKTVVISLCRDIYESHTLNHLLPSYLELVMQCLYVVLDTLDELGLILSDGSTDVIPHKESIVA